MVKIVVERYPDESSLPLRREDAFLISDSVKAIEEQALDILECPVIWVFLRSRTRTRGGVLGYIHGDWLVISWVWIDEALRSKGHGRALIRRIENEARSSSATSACVETNSVHNHVFYSKVGYKVAARIEGYPKPPYDQYLFTKELS